MNLQQAAEAISDTGMAVRLELERIGEHHSCIFAGAVLTEVLHRRGYPAAYALTVRAQIFNPVLTAWVKEHGFPSDPDSQDRCDAAGGRMIGLGVGPVGSLPPGRWAGHLVVTVPNLFGDRHAISDITITQACKPDWGIEFPTILFRVPDTFLTGETEFKAAANGSLIVYKAFPEDRSYDKSTHWTDRVRWLAVADRVAKLSK